MTLTILSLCVRCAKVRQTIPRNCRRFLYLYWQRLLHHSWLFYRLASSLPMDHSTTTLQLIRALCQSFCRTAISDIVWSDGGSQFTSNMFHQFSQQWGFLHKIPTPHYPQSDEKVEAMVKSMKKLSEYHGLRVLLTTISSVEHCCNTGTFFPTEMAYPQHRSFMDIQAKTLYQLTVDLLLKNGSSKLKQQNSKLTIPYSPLKHTRTNMHQLFQTFKSDLMLLFIIQVQNSGIYTALWLT